ncbi:MAG: type II toxin-antitoxin system HipA family toxin [Steroidobacteraceae bacterium]
MKHLYVWVRRTDGTMTVAGRLVTTEPAAAGRFESEFEYSAEWARDTGVFALDPVSLPLGGAGRRFRAEQFQPPLGAFDDALPDDWGRQLLARALTSEGKAPSPPQMLLVLRGGGTGALVFTETPAAADMAETLETRSLSALLAAASRFEAGTLPSNDEFRKLLEGSSRVGGARPKALVHDDEGEWVAKFPSRIRDGIHDVVGLEAICLELARRAGLTVPESRLQAVGRRRALLVRRLDVIGERGRIHMVSMRTLCRERPGVFVTSYSDLAAVLAKHSAAPSADLSSLFRYMVFNAAIGNVDDHLKNFWMLASPSGYRLAPAFDLIPDITGRREHTLAFQYGFACPTRAALLAVASDWRVPQAAESIDRVVASVARLGPTARKLRVRGPKSLAAIAADVRKRLALLAG